MEEYIKKEDVLKIIYDIKENRDIPKNYGTLIDIIQQTRNLPSSDVAEVKYGKWKNDGEDWFCTRCNHNALCDKMTGEEVLSILCPHCGAKMEQTKEVK